MIAAYFLLLLLFSEASSPSSGGELDVFAWPMGMDLDVHEGGDATMPLLAAVRLSRPDMIYLLIDGLCLELVVACLPASIHRIVLG
jgi:hypothetical protein